MYIADRSHAADDKYRIVYCDESVRLSYSTLCSMTRMPPEPFTTSSLQHLLLLLLLLLVTCASLPAGERTGENAVQDGLIHSFSIDSALASVGSVVQFHCRVTRVDGGSFVQLSKTIRGTEHQATLTTNVMKEDVIVAVERYSITAQRYGDAGYDFIFTITDTRAEDSGIYSCSVPARDETKHVQFIVVSEPTSLQLYVDGRLVDENDSVISYNNLTQVNITCLVVGGHPEPIVSMRTTSGHLELTDVHALCRSQTSQLLANVTCSAMVSVQQYNIDHSTSNRPVTCEARSLGSTHLPLSASFTPHLAAAPPLMKCTRSPVPTAVYQTAVRVLCHVTSSPPLSDARITWQGSQHLRPTARPGYPPGVKFDRDNEYTAYLRQRGDEIVLELEFEHVLPQMFRDYTFVVTNSVGTSSQTVTLVKDPTLGAVGDSGTCSFHDVIAHFAYVTILALTSLATVTL